MVTPVKRVRRKSSLPSLRPDRRLEPVGGYQLCNVSAMKPKRIKVRRAAGWKLPKTASYVGRPTVWGNPWKVGQMRPHETVVAYEMALMNGSLKDKTGRPLKERLDELRGRDLACWCDPDAPCHADVLLRHANS
ncbi:MAG TPA: DUF4326 domain-containing protein [Verrucomicrobiae bacterium]|nr:DUF4326 domain-containing protein [Verrucomicrobiae bacterium]